MNEADSSQLLTDMYNFPQTEISSVGDIKEMLPLLSHPNAFLRAGMLIQLGESRLLPDIVIPKVLPLIQDKDRMVREQAIITLSKYDSLATGPLVELLSNDRVIDFSMRVGRHGQSRVLLSDLAMIGLITCKKLDLKRLFEEGPTSRVKYVLKQNKYVPVSDILPYLNPSNKHCELALFALKYLGTAGDEAIPKVERLALSKDSYIREEALTTLPHLGTQALPVITSILKEKKNSVKEMEILISELRYFGIDYLPLLSDYILSSSNNISLRIRAVEVISDIGHFTIPVAKSLISLLLNRNAELAEAAAKALYTFSDDDLVNYGPTLAPLLIPGLSSSNKEIQSDVARVLSNMKDLGIYGDTAVITMLKAFDHPRFQKSSPRGDFDSDRQPPEQFIHAIGKIKMSQHSIVLPLFSKMLSDNKYEDLQPAIVETLGELGNIASPLVSLMLKSSVDRKKVFASLAHIKPVGVDNLITIASDRLVKDSIRVLALDALQNIESSDSRIHTVLKTMLSANNNSTIFQIAIAKTILLLGFQDDMAEQQLRHSFTCKNIDGHSDFFYSDKKVNVSVLHRLYATADRCFRLRLLSMLWEAGANPLVDEIMMEALNDENENIREEAGELLLKSDQKHLLGLIMDRQLLVRLARLIKGELNTKRDFAKWKTTETGGYSVTQPILPAFGLLRMVGPQAKPLLPLLAPLLNHSNPDLRLEAIETIGTIGIDTLGISTTLNQLLTENDRRIQIEAANALAMLQPEQQFSNPAFLAVSISIGVNKYFFTLYNDIADAFRPSDLVSGPGRIILPPFPWPPPKYAHKAKFGVEIPLQLIGTPSTTLSAVHLKLVKALTSTDPYFEQGLFGVPGGFALLAKMERINEDGVPMPGRFRWVMGKIPPRSLTDYIGQLFFENVGYFRIIAFVFTEESNFGSSDKQLPDIVNGGHELPAELVDKKLENVNGYVLVYSFKRVNGGSLKNNEQGSALNHLIASGVYNNMSH
ncbi:HEAT repeat protein [Chitinophaga ginsengisoli]|uniref:HEAT repeat protein n=2 Tax=Chitinophaga ginsengisoli TaxID=363837 RepID=A0A2P8FQM6_9BACT|nr:HEAT repeat protein [Chitinophaga ginsengisoli]